MRQFRFDGDSSTYLWKETPVNGECYSVEDIIRMRGTQGLNIVCDGSVEGIQAYIDEAWQEWTLMAEVPKVQEIYERGKWYDVKSFIPSRNYHNQEMYVWSANGQSDVVRWDDEIGGFVRRVDYLVDNVEEWYLFFDK